jgi:hypothetical protein
MSANQVAPLRGSELEVRLKMRAQTKEVLIVALNRAKIACLDENMEPIALKNVMQAAAVAFDMWANASMLPMRPRMVPGKGVIDVQEARVLDDVKAVARQVRNGN